MAKAAANPFLALCPEVIQKLLSLPMHQASTYVSWSGPSLPGPRGPYSESQIAPKQ